MLFYNLLPIKLSRKIIHWKSVCRKIWKSGWAWLPKPPLMINFSLIHKGYIKFYPQLVRFLLQRSVQNLVSCALRIWSSKLWSDESQLPTHYKCSNTGAILPVENPAVWILQNEEVPSWKNSRIQIKFPGFQTQVPSFKKNALQPIPD